MEPGEVTLLIEATRDDLVRDVVATLTELGLRRLTPIEIHRLRLRVLPHLHAVAGIATRYEQEKHDDEPTRSGPAPRPPEQGWTSEATPAQRPSKMPKRVRG